MSSTTVRLTNGEATQIAARFIEQIADVCDRVMVAGSLRRRLPMVGDIEIVAVPKVERINEEDMFGMVVNTANIDMLDARMSTLLDAGIVAKRRMSNGSPRWGHSIKLLTFEGAAVDLFCCELARFGWILALRTGPAEFSRQLVQPTDLKTSDNRRGLLPPHLKPRDGWLTRRVSGERIETPEESNVFEAFGLSYTQPPERV